MSKNINPSHKRSDYNYNSVIDKMYHHTTEPPTRPSYGKILAFGTFTLIIQIISLSGLETLNKPHLSTPVDSVSTILPTKD